MYSKLQLLFSRLLTCIINVIVYLQNEIFANFNKLIYNEDLITNFSICNSRNMLLKCKITNLKVLN